MCRRGGGLFLGCLACRGISFACLLDLKLNLFLCWVLEFKARLTLILGAALGEGRAWWGDDWLAVLVRLGSGTTIFNLFYQVSSFVLHAGGLSAEAFKVPRLTYCVSGASGGAKTHVRQICERK